MSYEIQKVVMADDTSYDCEIVSEMEEFLENADDLDDLLARLEFISENCDEQTESSIDYTNLPNFGGTEPDDTLGIWSWDETRLLVGDGCDTIVNRADYFK